MTVDLHLSQGHMYDNLYLLHIIRDYEFGIYENISADILMHSPHAMKAFITHDPDTTCLHESMCGPDWEVYFHDTSQDIAEL